VSYPKVVDSNRQNALDIEIEFFDLTGKGLVTVLPRQIGLALNSSENDFGLFVHWTARLFIRTLPYPRQGELYLAKNFLEPIVALHGLSDWEDHSRFRTERAIRFASQVD
jgi:hypothetical protein